ncbi:MAG: dephospho-CoA kinase [Prevotellaceae bacterium]|nr:dephospho-CoA kinase [Prevotellaceae bacterium]
MQSTVRNFPTAIAITGGIGSGKSVVSKIIKSYGHPVYDADYQAKFLMENSTDLKKQLINEFGNNIFVHGKLDKELLSTQIFNSQDNLCRINKIVHIAVFEDFGIWAKAQSSDLVFMESAIVFENNLQEHFDCIVAVVVQQKIRIERVMQRSDMTKAQILQRMKNQFTTKQLAQLSDFIIINNGKKALLPQIESFFKKLKKKWGCC